MVVTLLSASKNGNYEAKEKKVINLKSKMETHERKKRGKENEDYCRLERDVWQIAINIPQEGFASIFGV
jgi:hypothetical protein